MEKFQFDSDFYRRLKIFMFGVVLGTLIVYFVIWKDNRKDVYKWPSEIILSRLQKSKLTYSDTAKCLMKCISVSEIEIKELLKVGEINYSKSNVHLKPCQHYFIEGKLENGKILSALFTSCDSTAVMISINNSTTALNCPCK